MKILITGSSGFLGVHVQRAALERGHEVLAAARSRGPLWLEGVLQRPFDAERESGALLLSVLRPDAVISCAALSSIRLCEEQRALAQRINRDLPQELARETRRAETRLVHVSTDLVFDGKHTPQGGYAEDAQPNPLSEYGRSKQLGERAVLEADPAALVVRVPLLSGESYGRGRGARDSLLAAVARGEQPVCFEDEWRTPIDVQAVALRLVEWAEDATLRGHAHMAGPERLSRHELGLRVLAQAGLSAERIRNGTRAGLGMEHERPRDVSLACSRGAVPV